MTKGAIVLGDGDEDNASGVLCVWAAWDCFSSVFGFVLFLLFQKVEHTLKEKNKTKGRREKKALKTLKPLSCVNYFFPLNCSVNIQMGPNNNKSDKTHFIT